MSAKLRLYTTDSTVNGPAVYGTSSSWIESGTGAITWNTRPARASGVLADLGAVSSSQWVELNVTSLVTGNGTYSFVLATDNTDGLNIASRETGTPPQLVVVFSDTTIAQAAAIIPQATATNLPQPTATAQAPTAQPPAAGTGLQGDYYSDKALGTLVLTRVDPSVNFDWAYGSPDPKVAVDNFSIRWTGQVVPLYSETYTFYTQSDDGVRLWVNDQLLVDNWTGHAVTENKGQIALTAGQPANIRLEYYESGSNAVIKFLWSSTSQAKEILPQGQLLQPVVTVAAQAAVVAPSTTVEQAPALSVDAVVAPANSTQVEAAPALSQPVAAASTTATQLVEAETVQTTGLWTPYDSQLASGGRYVFSSGAANDALTLPFFGTSVDVVYVQHPALGSFALEVDGTVLQTVNSTAAEATFGVRASLSGLAAAPHILRIVATSGTIAIDALYVEPQTMPAAPVPDTSAPTVDPAAVIQPTQPVIVVPPTDIPLPTATPLPVTIPYTDAFEGGFGWTLSGLWRLDTMAGYSGTALFADATQRGQSSRARLRSGDHPRHGGQPHAPLLAEIQPDQRRSARRGNQPGQRLDLDRGRPADRRGGRLDRTQHRPDAVSRPDDPPPLPHRYDGSRAAGRAEHRLLDRQPEHSGCPAPADCYPVRPDGGSHRPHDGSLPWRLLRRRLIQPWFRPPSRLSKPAG